MSGNKRGAERQTKPSAKGQAKGAEMEPNAEVLWERVGYAGAAVRHSSARDNAASAAFDFAMADVARCGAYVAPRVVEAARERGKARWLAEHPEVRA
jgi:hypothetical protein